MNICLRNPSFQLHIDAGAEEPEEEKEETDFFLSLSTSQDSASAAPGLPVAVPVQETQPDQSGPAPDVSIGLTAPVAAPVPKKSTIGAKKAPAKKSGLGAKKGRRTLTVLYVL